MVKRMERIAASKSPVLYRNAKANARKFCEDFHEAVTSDE